jgi:hypothetical protein
LVYLFTQLQLSKIPLFKEAIDAWHIAYLEAKLPQLHPEKLLKMADDKIQILKHAGQWKELDTPDIMALQLELQQQKRDSDRLVRTLVAHVSRLAGTHRDNNQLRNKHPHEGHHQGNHHKYPPWMIIPPQYPTETKLVDHRLYTWCTKCRQGQGLWVCRHNTETHVDGYSNNRNQRRRLDRPNNQTTGHKDTYTHNQREYSRASHGAPPLPTAQLSLLDYLDNYLPDGESHPIWPEEEAQQHP